MMLVGAVSYLRGSLVILSQILGGIASAALVSAMLPGPLQVSTALGGGTTVVQGLFIEMFLTAMLVFTIFMLAAEKHKATFVAPVGIGLALFVAELFGVYYTGGSLNPARSFGPAVVLHSFHSYHWSVPRRFSGLGAPLMHTGSIGLVHFSDHYSRLDSTCSSRRSNTRLQTRVRIPMAKTNDAAIPELSQELSTLICARYVCNDVPPKSAIDWSKDRRQGRYPPRR